MPRTKTQLKAEKQRLPAEKGAEAIPAWRDCTWKRIPCGHDDCPICSRIKEERERHIARGEDPDSIEAAFEDADNFFRETFILTEQKADKDPKNDQAPSPLEFILYHKILRWRDNIALIADLSDDTSSTWLFTEAGEDLLWYADTLLSKVHRQLVNRWHLAKGRQGINAEYAYTGRVLSECLAILKGSLSELSRMEITQKLEFNIALLFLTGLEKEIISI
ncbi:hypothetical protein A2303_02715 [Candidatus Falkowbacteria bacterium RIFOXYB2_FULL_47_14]|uniref:Uncharacterized protein n=1 Tax=Candidatus Falkowbacteria bacterium RIFOXYA2_FULL_47_19 TaxID=1797994 RepID=A0A1F5SH29_9BACT|nr:MAG: hypothetical protein A2227_05715 [Candidatus Falkowbacteria bacterium RIFOXYA2_FULL_47_19]OGF34510.1 MAG: hypothetical protein A2468_04760 [Candidatus Falkowbacteria bacterium RIFOXYC2_FULL_46_15]OGF43035.1 MAG: hypothetical protein A2303_02715 [Candidatus Falkowbacteria bacterium RIFOXYB2_FULL_47_14]